MTHSRSTHQLLNCLEWRLPDDSSRSQSQSYVTTDGQSASLSWCQAPIWGLRPDFYYCQTIAGLLMWDAISDERTDLPLTIVAGLRQRIYSWVHHSSQSPSPSYFTTGGLPPINLSWRQAPWDSWPEFFFFTPTEPPLLSNRLRFFLYMLGSDHPQKTQFYCFIRKITQKTSYVIASQRLYWCAVA
jgi:hypothetical protein